MQNILAVLYGLVFGIANVIPGVSGGTMLVVFGCYDKVCGALTLNLKEIKKNIVFLIFFGIGAVLGIVGFAFVVTWLFENFPTQTNMFFMGLIIGSVPLIIRNATVKDKFRPTCIVPFIIALAAVVGLALAESGSLENDTNMCVAGFRTENGITTVEMHNNTDRTVKSWEIEFEDEANVVLDGKVTGAVIDAVQANVNFDKTGKITTDLTAEIKTKNELGDEYGMKNASSIQKEWNEQAAAFAKYCLGKTADEITGIAAGEDGKPADADLAASVSIAVGDFISLVKKAGEVEASGGAANEATAVKTGFAISATLSAENAGEKDGSTTTEISVVAVTVTEEGVIESCAIDAIQGKVTFTAEGIVSSEAGEVLSKKELGDDYRKHIVATTDKKMGILSNKRK